MTARTLLFTDVVDSTMLVERAGDARATEVWAEHDRRARDLLAQHRGREIDRTDGFFLLFDTVQDAARFALAYHAALRELGLPARVGLHTGEVTLRENPAADVARGAKPIEVEGLAKPFAARVMALAAGGQTLLSADARGALGDTEIGDTAIESHGHYRLKGIDAPVEVFELGMRGLGAFAPPPDADKAYRVVRAGELWLPLREARHNLPVERDAFVGRSGELRRLAQRLDAGARLLTVLGPGGTGKTRFVVRYGWSWLGDWPGGVHFCDLSEARSLEGIFGAVAMTLGVPLGDADPGAQLGHAIAARGQCLMILDNFEQVVEHAGATLGRWLDRAAEARFVVTSRERLRLVGEVLFPVEPLPLAREAIDLFEARARNHSPGFAIDAANRPAVAEVVRLLDGLPLAIELAAARVRVLSPALLVERMRDRFSLLAGVRGVAARQATLRAAIDWSWNLLADWEQATLAQCSVFEGRFTLPAAEAVLDLSRWPSAPPAMDAVESLVDKSLLRSWPGATNRLDIDEPYFGMYVSIHEYASDHLDDEGRRSAHLRHGAYFAGFGSEAAIEMLARHGGTRRRRELAAELDDLVVACRRAVDRGDAPIATATYRAAAEVFEQQGPMGLAASLGTAVRTLGSLGGSDKAAVMLSHAAALEQIGATQEARSTLDDALALCRAEGLRRLEGRVMVHLAVFVKLLGTGVDTWARDALRQAVAIARETGDRVGEGVALANLGNAESDLGDMDESVASFHAALALHREIGNRRAEAIVLGNIGAHHLDRGERAAAHENFEAALEIHREIGNLRSASVALVNLGSLNFYAGRLDDAEACYREALANDRAVGSRAHEGMVLTTLVLVHDARGDPVAALACCREALAIAREVGRPPLIAYALTNLAGLHTQQGRIAEARATLAEAEPIERSAGRLQFAKFLCVRCVADHAAGDHAAAREALAESEAIALEIGAGPGSALQILIANVRAETGLDQ